MLVLLGAGPGVGQAVARRFHDDGYRVVLVARDATRLAQLGDDLMRADTRVDTVALDLTDDTTVRAAVDEIGRRFGRIDVVHFNPSAWRQLDPLHLGVEQLLDDLRLGVTPLLSAVQAARPYLTSGARIVVTGSAAADRPWHEAASLGVQKAAVRNLVISLDATLATDGIRAVNVQVDGVLAESGTFSPLSVSAAIHSAVLRPDDAWTPVVHHPG